MGRFDGSLTSCIRVYTIPITARGGDNPSSKLNQQKGHHVGSVDRTHLLRLGCLVSSMRLDRCSNPAQDRPQDLPCMDKAREGAGTDDRTCVGLGL